MKKINSLFTMFSLLIATALFSSPIYTNYGGHGHGKKGSSDTKMFVGAGVGVGMPMANFGKKDTLGGNDTTHITGWAKPGFSFHIAGGYMFSDNVGAMISVGGNMNGFDTKTFMTVNNFPSGSTVTSTSHYTGSYLVGPAFLFPIGSGSIQLHAHVLVGLLTSKYSVITETGSIGPVSFSDTHTLTPVKTFGYDAGAAILIHGFAIGLDYLGGTPKFTTETITSGSSSSTSSGHSYAMSVGLINLSVGYVYAF